MTAPVRSMAADLVTEIPGATAALNYLAAKLAEFEGTGPRIRQAQHKAAQLRYVAQQQGRADKAAQLDTEIQRLGDLASKRDQTADMLRPITGWLRDNGFGIVLPVVIAIAAVAAVAAVTYVITQTSLEEKRLDLLAQGLLTPEQLTELEKQTKTPPLFNFDFGAVVPYAIAGLGIWWLLNSLKPGNAAERGGRRELW